jgi:hypothetical protein
MAQTSKQKARQLGGLFVCSFVGEQVLSEVGRVFIVFSRLYKHFMI